MSSPGGNQPIEQEVKLKFTAAEGSAEAAVADVSKKVAAANKRNVGEAASVATGTSAGPSARSLGRDRNVLRDQQFRERANRMHEQGIQRRDEWHGQVLTGQRQRSTNAQRNEADRQDIKQGHIARQRSTLDSMTQSSAIRNPARVVNAQAYADAAARRVARQQRGSSFAGNMGMSMAHTMRSPLTYYAAAQGNFGPLLGGVGRGLFNAGLQSFNQYGAYRAAVASSAGGALNPISAGQSAAALPALSRLGSMAPAFGLAGAAVAAGAIYAGGSSLFAGVNQSNIGLGAAMNSSNPQGRLPNSSGMYASLAGAASNYAQSVSTADALAGQLGGQGVQSNQLNQQVQNTMALGAFSGIKPQDLNAMTGQMAMGGGMSQEAVGQAYGKLVTQQQLTGISIGKMVDSLKTLEQATNGTNVNISALAAVAKIAGGSMTGAQIGQATSSLMNTSGVGSMTTAAVLGISQSRLSELQSKGNVAGLTDAAANALKRMVPAGGSMASRVNMAETINSSLGLFDMSTTSGAQQKDFFRTMLTGAPGQFSKLAAQIQSGTSNPSAGTFRSAGSATASDSNSVVTNTLVSIQSAALTALNAISSNDQRMLQYMQSQGSTPGKPGGGGGGGADPGGTGGGGAASMTINRSTVPGGVANSSYSFTSSQTRMIQAAAKRYGVPWKTLMSQIAREGWSPSNPGIGGPGQFEPGTAAGLAADKNSPVYGQGNFTGDYAKSMMATAYMDKGLYNKYGTWQQALAAYNGGPGGMNSGAAQAYGADVVGSAQTIVVSGTMVLKDSLGRHIGTGHIDPAKVSAGKRGSHQSMPVPGGGPR